MKLKLKKKVKVTLTSLIIGDLVGFAMLILMVSTGRYTGHCVLIGTLICWLSTGAVQIVLDGSVRARIFDLVISWGSVFFCTIRGREPFRIFDFPFVMTFVSICISCLLAALFTNKAAEVLNKILDIGGDAK